MVLLSSPAERPQLAQLAPRPTDRALIVGQTGSGKSTLARVLVLDALVRRQRYVVALDHKGLLRWPGFTVCKTLRELLRCRERAILYRPSYEDTVNELLQGAVWEWLYKRGHTTIYADETAAIVQGDVYPYYYGACLMRGRELGLELWSATQRPLRIPQITLSESEHVYCFRLRLPQDRQRVESLTGVEADYISALAKREFVYAPQDGAVMGPFTLALPGGSVP